MSPRGATRAVWWSARARAQRTTMGAEDTATPRVKLATGVTVREIEWRAATQGRQPRNGLASWSLRLLSSMLRRELPPALGEM